MSHFPVLRDEALEYLAIRPEGTYLDATAGLGGHTGEIARRLTTGKVIASDRDAESLAIARQNTLDATVKIQFIHATFSTLADVLAEAEFGKVDGLLADLGVSRFQLTEAPRGFSFMTDGPLDMRMDQSRGATASDLVNRSAEKALADWIHQLGGERRARKIARAIVRSRPIRSTLHLAGVVERAVPRTGRLHPATLTFQALRMVVNSEQDELDRLLEIAPRLVHGGGRIVMISFMSLEDGKVKRKFREWEKDGVGKILTKRPIEPSEEETRSNPPSRSAKLRAFEVVG
ncbi:MAG: 16S rRNA (cytosine(1402)-N(4))-methyltransferase RsmH [Acidobacteriota bacterium]|nr:16S rRNA (cytosine(1402)-N(4))-methyltransferase RsmH [Acidobacteriota bacterium]